MFYAFQTSNKGARRDETWHKLAERYDGGDLQFAWGSIEVPRNNSDAKIAVICTGRLNSPTLTCC